MQLLDMFEGGVRCAEKRIAESRFADDIDLMEKMNIAFKKLQGRYRKLKRDLELKLVWRSTK